MEILAARTLRASSLVFQQGTDSPTLAVVAKVTFHLTPGTVRLAEPDVQEVVVEEDNHWDDDPGRSLRFASDLVPCKGRVDVLLDASAQAPADGRPNVVMRLIVGERARPLVDKVLLVSPPQFVMPNGSVQREAWPSTLSIRYERSAGGRGTANPAGVDLNGPPDPKGRLPRPCVDVFPGKPACEPIGFGPIAPTWPTRMAKWTGSGQGISAQNGQRLPYPADFRWSYFNVAPEDQQIDAILQGNERIVLENIVSNVPVFETQLVGYRLQGYVRRSNGSTEALLWTCDTLLLDATRMRLVMVWRAHVKLSSAKEAGRIGIALAPPSQKFDYAEVARLSGLNGDEGSGSTQILSRVGKRKGTLKIDRSASAAPKTGSLAPDETQPFPPNVVKSVLSLRKTTQELPQHGQVSSALPFVKNTVPPSPPPMIRASSPGEMNAPPLVESAWAKGAMGTLPPLPVVPAPDVRPAEPATLGVLAASNAAAGTAEKAAAKEKVIEVVAKNELKAKDKPKEIIELLWYDPAALPRIRRHLGWKKIIADLKPRPSDDDFDGGLPPEQMKAAKDKRDVLGVLARGEVMDLEGIRRVMDMAVLDDGSFVPPYVLTQGTLEFQFDEVETLKSMLLVVAPFVPGDKKLKETVDLINEVMKTPGIERAKRVAEGLTKRLKEAFYQQNRGVGPGYLDDEVEVILVEGRCYRTIDMMGSEWYRGFLSLRGGVCSILTNSNYATFRHRSAMRSFDARLIVQASGLGNEPGGATLHAVALASPIGTAT